MIYCSSCGSAFEDDARFCSYCGSKAETETTAPPPQPDPVTPPPPPPAPPPIPVARPEKPSPKWDRDAPISAWGYFGWLLLFSIPAIGWLFFLMAVCGAFGNRNVTSLARGYLLFVLLGIVFAIITVLIILLILPWGWGWHYPDAMFGPAWGDWWRQMPWYR
jgi:hypothetical protein